MMWQTKYDKKECTCIFIRALAITFLMYDLLQNLCFYEGFWPWRSRDQWPLFEDLRIKHSHVSLRPVLHYSNASYLFKKHGFLWRYSHYSYVCSAVKRILELHYTELHCRELWICRYIYKIEQRILIFSSSFVEKFWSFGSIYDGKYNFCGIKWQLKVQITKLIKISKLCGHRTIVHCM